VQLGNRPIGLVPACASGPRGPSHGLLPLSLSKLGALRDATQALTAFVSALSGGSGDVVSGLDQLARGVKEGVTESNGGFQLLLEKIKEIRRETGKPIDTGIAQELADKYKLTEEQANVLYRAILDINKALSFQETAIKQFNEFVSRNGYEDLAIAADDYKNRLYELIVAEQIQKEQLKRTGQPTIEADKTIADYRKVIDIVNEYVAASVTGEEKVQKATEATVINLKFYQNALKNVNEAFESLALSQDASGRFTEKTLSGLRILAAESVGLEDFIKRVNRLKESFRNLDIVIKPPDLTPLINGFKTIQETAGALTFEKTVTSAEAMTARIEASMKKLITTTKSAAVEMQVAAVDLSGPISSAFSGIAEAIGNSIAGVGDFGQDILKVVANFGKQLGEILIAQGVALLAVKLALKNPIAAIAAGVALVAISTAAGAAISKAHSSTVGGSTGSTASRTATENSRSISASATEAQDVKVTGNAVIKGQDLYVIFQNYENNNRFTKANG
jgi:hypothetical protein